MSVVFTERLRLEPIGPAHAHDLWRIHDDPEVARWYDGRPTPEAVEAQAAAIGRAWQRHGVHKWMAYDRVTNELIGRGGLSRVPVDDDWGQIHSLLPPDEAWVAMSMHTPVDVVHARWLEIGWALLPTHWGNGYASEIGRAGLTHAFDVLDAQAVVSCTAVDNERSRAVMSRIGMTYAGDIVSEGEALAVSVMLRPSGRAPAPSSSPPPATPPAGR
jgi:RimJ/RimL family protein N-acetyltransferase